MVARGKWSYERGRVYVSGACRRKDAGRKTTGLEFGANAALWPRWQALRIQSLARKRSSENQPELPTLFGRRTKSVAPAGIRKPVRSIDDAALCGCPSARRTG